MRITKVKLNNRMVLIQRNSDRGHLILKPNGNKTSEIRAILDEKKLSFIKSVINKTVIASDRLKTVNQLIRQDGKIPSELTEKDKEFYKKKNKNNKNILSLLNKIVSFCFTSKNIISAKYTSENLLGIIKQVHDSYHLLQFIGHKFQLAVTYKNINNEIIKFNLSEDLFSTLKKIESNKCQNIEKDIKSGLKNYIDWAESFIQSKKSSLEISIRNNKIQTGSNQSLKQEVLACWANIWVNDSKNGSKSFDTEFDDLECIFELHKISQDWNEIFNYEEKVNQEHLASSNKNTNENLLGLPTNYFEFKRKLKTILTNQQHGLHKQYTKNELLDKNGKIIAELDWKKLSVYSLAVTHYLALYFPLKKSGKRLTASDVEYYLEHETISKTIRNILKNNIRAYVLQQGKLIYHNLNSLSLINGSNLESIKIQEAFTAKLIDACAFSSHNLRNCFIKAYSKNVNGKINNDDILTKKTLDLFIDGVLSNTESKAEFINQIKTFFLSFSCDSTHEIVDNSSIIRQYLEDNKDNFIHFVCGVRGAIQAIRNNVYHYKPNSLGAVFSVSDFEITNGVNNVNIQYDSNNLPFKDYFNSEIENIPFVFSQKIKSTGVFDYYPLDLISGLLNRIDLNNKKISFTPSFKKIFNQGRKYLLDQKYPLALRPSLFFDKIESNDSSDGKLEAKYYLLKLIYEEKFIHYFIDPANQSFFSGIVDTVLLANQKRAEATRNFHAKSFSDVTSFNDWLKTATNHSVEGYLMYIQSQIILEENKKRDDERLASNETGNFQKFVLVLFLKGFNDFMELEEIDIEPELQFDQSLSQSEQANIRNNKALEYVPLIQNSKINSDDPAQIAFWILCKMLDATHLNELKHQFLKLLQATLEQKITFDSSHLMTLLQIIELVLLNTDRILTDHKESDYYVNSEVLLKPFIHDRIIDNKCSPYFGDKNEPIIFSHVALSNKYSTRKVLDSLFTEENQVKYEDLCRWETSKNLISKLSMLRMNIHRQWSELEEQKNKKNFLTQRVEKSSLPEELHVIYDSAFAIAKNEAFLKKNRNDLKINQDIDQVKVSNIYFYQALCNAIDQYNWLDNFIHLYHIKKLHLILIDILGRFVGYVRLFERDLKYMLEFFKSKIDDIQVKELTIEDKLDLSNSLFETSGFKSFIFDNKFLDSSNRNFQKSKIHNNPNWKIKRNFFAHLNYLTLEMHPSLIQQLSYIRDLTMHDRKLKNAVIKSFITLLENHGVKIKLRICHQTQQITLESCASMKIKHLGGKYESDIHQPEFIQMVKRLLTFESN